VKVELLIDRFRN